MRPSNIEAILDGLKHGFELIIIDLPLIRMMTPGYALSPHLDGVALIARTTSEMELIENSARGMQDINAYLWGVVLSHVSPAST